MFMFRSKRATLTRRLLRSRLINETLSENEELLRTLVISKLQDNQLELLVEIIEKAGHIDNKTTCIPISTTTNCISRKKCNTSVDNTCFCCTRLGGARETATRKESSTRLSPPPHFLCCQTYRWPQLQNINELKKLPQCTCDSEDDDDVNICCNPYHWSRLCGPESPPPPYRRYPDEKLRPEDRAPSESGKSICSTISSSSSDSSRHLQHSSLPTSGNGSKTNGEEWCKLAYWELQRRVGALFGVSTSTVHVFSAPPQPGSSAASFCLADIASQQPHPQASTETAISRTRTKIGLGVLLSQEDDGVWAYNLSDGPLFVNSPTLDEPHSRTLVVYKLPPGSCLRIFDWNRASKNRTTVDPICGPIDPHSVRISFAKGWGPKYSRQEVTACPCWLEVLLAPPR